MSSVARALLFGVLAATGCGATLVATAPGPVYSDPGYPDGQIHVPSGPPAPPAEFPPPAPGPGYAWVSGYWDWTGYEWYWVGGHWAPSQPGYIYVRPRYVVSGGTWIYHRGYWRDHDGHREYGYGRPTSGWHGVPAPAAHPAQGGWHGGPTPGWQAPAAAPPARQGGWQGSPSPAPAPAHGGWHGGPATSPPPAQQAGGNRSPAPPAAAPARQGGWHGTPATPDNSPHRVPAAEPAEPDSSPRRAR